MGEPSLLESLAEADGATVAVDSPVGLPSTAGSPACLPVSILQVDLKLL